MSEKTTPSRADYAAVFEAERDVEYPAIDTYEAECGFALSRHLLERAARVLACPVKVAPPNWQHGRVIYSTLRRYLASPADQFEPIRCLDIGTAKGFSALCARWALVDSGVRGHVTSVDVIDPEARVPRNTVADVDGPRTLREILESWPDADDITFAKSSGTAWLNIHRGPYDFAFVDGKHRQDVVSEELRLLADRQSPGHVTLLDDVQIPGVRAAIEDSEGYDVRYLEAKPERAYAIAVRR